MIVISLVDNGDPDEMYGCLLVNEDDNITYNQVHNSVVDILNGFKDDGDDEWTIEDLVAILQEEYSNIQYVPLYKFKEIPV